MATHGPVTYESVEMTPQLADEWIEKYNIHNRGVRDWRVKLIVKDIENGRYLEAGENGVTFDWDGNIAAGQHTLYAVRQAGRTVRMRVTRNVDPAVRDVLNDSLKERLADRLAANNVRGSGLAEAILRKALFYEKVALDSPNHTGGLVGFGNQKFSKGDLMNEWIRYAQPITATIEATTEWDSKNIWPGNRGTMHFLWWLLVWRTGCNPERVREFYDRVCYGSQDPNEKILFNRLKVKFREYPATEHQLYFLLKAWRSWVTGENLTILQAPRDSINPATHKMVLTNKHYPKPYKVR